MLPELDIEKFVDICGNILTFIVLPVCITFVIFYIVTTICHGPTAKQDKISVVEFDNHEYLIYDNRGGLCHKQNCKFCKETNE